jgi:subtilase family serine protease
MLRLAVLAAAAGLLVSACAGSHSAGSVLPATAAPQSAERATRDAAVAVPLGWAATATHAATIPGATDKGALAPSTPLTVRVGLNLRNAGRLQSAVAAGQQITRQQFAAQYGPTTSEVQSVVAYLQSQGFHNVKPGAQIVSADGTAALAAKAFDTTLESFSLGGAPVYVNTQPALVPTSLGGVVSAVLGLSNAGKMSARPNLTRVHASCLISATPTGQCAPSFNAADVQKFYDVGNATDGSLTTVAVIAEGNVSQVLSDLQFAETTQGLPQVPVNVVTVGLASPDTANIDEWDLDTQSSTGMAQNVQQLTIYATTSLADSDIANAYDRWVSDDSAQLGNSSFGECEYQANLDGAMKIDDNLFLEAASQGQTMFASAGDTGSSCALAPTNGVPASGPPMVSYPASAPYVVAVGGTTVVANADGTYSGEAAWNAGGGGISQFENGMTWQQGVTPAASTGLAAANLRAVPDIAMAADSVSGAYNVYSPNLPGVGNCSSGCAVGGTSEASPLAMGASARFVTFAHQRRLHRGFMATYFYRNYAKYQGSAATVNGPPPTQALGGFHDIISGANGAYTALPGYDYTTGLGTLDIKVMNNDLKL